MRNWSDRELETATQLMRRGVPADQIGAAVGRSESVVRRKVERVAAKTPSKACPTRKYAPPDRSQRKCLACGSMFPSEGVGNRICENCAENNRALGHLEGVTK